MKNFKLLVCLALICSCTSSHPYLKKRTSLVVGYYEFNEIGANWKIDTIDAVDYARLDLYIPKAHLLTDIYRTDKVGAKLYKSYSIKHKDRSSQDIRSIKEIPSEVLESLPHNVNHCSYPAFDFVGVSITANKQWNDSHPKGSLLDDIAYFVGISPNQFISNSYRVFDPTKKKLSVYFNHVFFSSNSLICWNFHYPIDKKVCDLTKDDLPLLGPGRMAEPGGIGYEEPDILYYAPDVPMLCDSDRFDWEDNLCSIFIPIERDGVERSLTVTLTDENGTDYSTTVTIE